MPQYAQAITIQGDELFPKCGTRDIASNVSNVSAVAGEHYCIVHDMELSVCQPYNELGLSGNSAAFKHQLTLVIPDYEPIQSSILNVINEHKTIQQLTINAVRRMIGGGDTLTGQYIGENGLLTDYHRHHHTEGEGEITLSFIFEKLRHENHLSNTSGLIQTSMM